MSEPTAPTRPFYVTGGTLKVGEPSYVERRADTELFESLLAGEFCYVLTARQMGKSSRMARTAKRLEQADVCSAIVDLTQIGSERGAQAASQWYFGIANKIHQQLKIDAPLRPWWQERADLPPVQRLTDFFLELVLTHCPGRVVIFVDEIDSTIGLPFADDFFAALRACFNARATEPAFERLTFVLLGVASPDQLIQDPARTPFNIGKRVDLADFTPAEAQTLAPGLHADPDEADRRLERVLHWTGGHPYLSQALCRAVRERAAESRTAEEAVDPWVEELFLSSRAQREETNLKHARARLEKRGPEGRRLLQLYRRVRQGKPVPDQPTSPLFAQLKLAGVVKATDEGRLAVRNRIYEEVFTPEWARSAMPVDRGRQLAAATVAASLVGVLVWYAAFQPRPYKEAFQGAIKDDAYNVALDAYTNLRANPFSRPRATELMQQFWEQRALRYALTGDRDESLLSYLQGLSYKDSQNLRRQAQNLVGPDYASLQFTLRYADEISDAAFSPDGRTFATESAYYTRLWDAESGKPLSPSLQHQSTVKALAFSPNGRILATGSMDDTARLWDAATGKLLFSLKHESTVYAIAFSPDGRTLATGSWDGTVRLWDMITGKPLAPPLRRQGGVMAVAFSPDSRRLATGSIASSACLWDLGTGHLLATLLPHEDDVTALAFSPDGRTLATGFNEGAAGLWNAVTGKLLAPLLDHNNSVVSVMFSPDGRILATGSWDGTARLWEVGTGRPLAPLVQHKEAVFAVAFSLDGRTLTTGSGDGTVRLWDVRSEKPLSPIFQYQEPVATVAFSPDGGVFLTRSGDKAARLWDARSGKSVLPPLQPQGSVLAVAFSPDRRAVLTGSADHTARLWDARSGKPLLPPLQHQDSVLAVAFSPEGRTVLTGARDGTARLWDARSGKPLLSPLQHQSPVISVAFSLDGRTVLTGADHTAHLWDARTGKPLTPPLQLPGAPMTLAFNPDGKSFFMARDHWLDIYSWDGKKAVPQSSQLLHGLWKKGFRFPSDCERCIQVALGDTSNSFHLETLHLDEPADPPIEGDPKELLEKWKSRLGLKFDDQMKPVPAVDLPGAPAGALGDGRRSPGAGERRKAPE
jgi:WD40 repeat protein